MNELTSYRMLAGGQCLDPLSGESFDSINPFTGRLRKSPDPFVMR